MSFWTGVFGPQYISSMRPVFNKDALYSDTTEHYLTPCEPEPYGHMRIRFRSGKNNVDEVFLDHDEQAYRMKKVSSVGDFDFYELDVQLSDKPYRYCFHVQAGAIEYYYDQRGATPYRSPDTLFSVIPGFRTPHWAKGAVMYQIYVDRFYNGNPSNDVLDHEYYYLGGYSHKVPAENWDKYPDADGVREFYGGDLDGVLQKLDYLKELGIEVIYFNPLFVSPSNHKYDIQDYDYIDPHFGRIVMDEGNLLEEGDHSNKHATRYITRVSNLRNLEASNALFAKVVDEAHKRGIRVIIDGVFNHCGSFNKWLDREQIYEHAPGYEKGAFISEASPYRGCFFFHDEHAWPYNATYDGWWGHDTLPKLHYEGSPSLYEYIMHIARKWVSPPFNADGWRLDVAADLGMSPEMNHRFWADFRRTVKLANPNAIILAEHYGDPSPWLQGDQWDSIMNYDAFMEPLTWFLTGMEKHSDEYRHDLLGNIDAFWNAMYYGGAKLTMPSKLMSMNELSNHDHSRFLTRTNRKVGRTGTLGPEAANENVSLAVMREAVLVQMTWPGAATLYYGDEAGVCGFTDPDNRRTYPWGHENKQLLHFHKAAIRLRKKRPELRTGSLKRLGGEHNFLSFARFDEARSTVVLINNNEYEIEVKVPVWLSGIPKECELTCILSSDRDSFTELPQTYEVHGGKLSIRLPGYSGRILVYGPNA